MILRPYQDNALAQIRAARAAGHRRILLCMPTGSGKTVVATRIIRGLVERGKRVLVVAHLRELLDQFDRALRGPRAGDVTPEVRTSFIRGDDPRFDATA